MDARRHEGKEMQGLMRSLKDACGQYRNFLAGSLPESMWTAPEQRKHVHTHTRSAGVQGHAHVRGAESRPQQRPLKIAASKNDVGGRSLFPIRKWVLHRQKPGCHSQTCLQPLKERLRPSR